MVTERNTRSKFKALLIYFACAMGSAVRCIALLPCCLRLFSCCFVCFVARWSCAPGLEVYLQRNVSQYPAPPSSHVTLNTVHNSDPPNLNRSPALRSLGPIHLFRTE